MGGAAGKERDRREEVDVLASTAPLRAPSAITMATSPLQLAGIEVEDA